MESFTGNSITFASPPPDHELPIIDYYVAEILNWTISYWMPKVIVKSRISVCVKKASVGEPQPPLFAEPLTTSHLR